jgi:hypothetical protein
MSPSSLLLLLVGVVMSCVGLTPLVSADCGIGGIDLSSLSSEDFTFTDEKQQDWLVRPCGPTTNEACLKAGAQTSSCEDSTAYGFWTTQLWHKWSFLVSTRTRPTSMHSYSSPTLSPSAFISPDTHDVMSVFKACEIPHYSLLLFSSFRCDMTLRFPLTSIRFSSPILVPILSTDCFSLECVLLSSRALPCLQDPNNPTGGVQLYMEGSPAPQGCNDVGSYYSWIQFPCSPTQGNLTVVEGSNCSANYTIPTPLTCRAPLEEKIVLTEF